MPHLEKIKRKILSGQELDNVISGWKLASKRIVFTNGCFDLLHLGHVDYLSKAADLGDVLIIGINSDSSVSSIKGKNRPINDQISRSMVLASLCFVDAVVLFNEDTPIDLIKTVLPDILVKGSDYSAENIVGADVVMANGGQIHTIPFVAGYSTSSIEAKILSMK